MKNPFHRNSVIWRIAFIGIISFYYILYFIIERDTVETFDPQLILMIFYILFLFINFIIEVIETFKTKSILSFTTTVFGLLSIFSFYLTNYIIDLRDSSPIIIKSKNIDGVFLDLREDKTFKFSNGNWAEVKISRGNYSLKDSIVILDKNKLDNIEVSKKWVIRKDTTFNRTYLIQLDKKGKVINENFKFEVISDKRKKHP